MYEQLMSMYTQFADFAKMNPVIAGAVSLYGLGILTYFTRYLPGKIWNFVKSQCFTTITLDNSSTGEDNNSILFRQFNRAFVASSWSKYSRDMKMHAVHQKDRGYVPALIPGSGKHLLFYKGRLYWLTKTAVQPEKSNNVTLTSQLYEKLHITTYGRSHKNFDPILEMATPPVSVDLDKYTFNQFFGGGCWFTDADPIRKRTLDTINIDDATKKYLVDEIEWFIKNREWFEEREIPYKLAIVLYGPPGTGKTSLIRALASHFNRNIATMTLTDSYITLEKQVRTLREDAFGVFEDISDAPAVQIKNHKYDKRRDFIAQKTSDAIKQHSSRKANRALESTDEPALTPSDDDKKADLLSISKSELLNLLDGVVPLDGQILIFTTNYLEDIDPVFLRAGRIDLTVKIDLMTDKEVRQFINRLFPGYEIPEVKFANIAGSDLQMLYREYYTDYDRFISSIPIEEPNKMKLIQNGVENAA